MTQPTDSAPRCPDRLPLGSAGTRCQLAPHRTGAHLHLYDSGHLAWVSWQDANPQEAPGSPETGGGPEVAPEPSPARREAGRPLPPPNPSILD